MRERERVTLFLMFIHLMFVCFSLSQPDSELKLECQAGSSLTNVEVDSWAGSDTQSHIYRQGIGQEYHDPEFPPKPVSQHCVSELLIMRIHI